MEKAGTDANNLLKKAKIIADFQFGAGAGEVLFNGRVAFLLSKTGRISQIKDKKAGSERRIATLRSSDGLLTLGLEGAERLQRTFKYPRLRVVVNEESSEFVRAGGTAFCKHVVDADPAVRAYDEVILVDEADALLATGRAVLSGEEMKVFEHGVAVKVRHAVGN